MRQAKRIAGAAVLLALGDCMGTTIDGGSAVDAPVAANVTARCAAPHGSREVPETAAAFARALAGRWLVCGHDASSSSFLLARDGIDFSLDGHWSLLKADNIGGYEHTVNDGTFGTYSMLLEGTNRLVPPTDLTPASAVSLHLSSPALDLRVDFEVSPSRLVTRGPMEIDFVRLDNEPDEPIPYTSKEGELCSGTLPCRAGLRCEQATLDNDAGVVGICVRDP